MRSAEITPYKADLPGLNAPGVRFVIGSFPLTDGARPSRGVKTIIARSVDGRIQHYSRGGHHDPNLSVPKTAFELIWWRRSASDSSGGLGSARTYLVRAFDDTKKQ